MKHLKLNDFKKIYRLLKTGVPPVDFLILGFLVWLEEAYIDYKVEKEVTEAIEEYHEEMDKIEKDWKETAIIKEEWTSESVSLPTLSITNPVVEKDEAP